MSIISNYEFISVSSIVPHENNPRKEIIMNDEFKELVNSIKANGILQHLTVVPFDGGYKCVIGHRRLAAAKKAGLESVPCLVEDMTEEEQLHTMMMENMQRHDLTAREQALGFQMMIDMGETVTDVAKKTGFSKATISHRTKMLKLDEAKLAQAEARNAKMEDYIKLEQIKDMDVRNKVLDSIGTNNFDMELHRALDAQEKMDKLNKYEAAVKKFAQRIEHYGEVNGEAVKMCRVASYDTWEKEKEVVPVEGECYYVRGSYGITVYKKGEIEKTEEDLEREEKTRLYREHLAKLEQMRDDCIALRDDFIKNFSAYKKFADHIRNFYFTMSLTAPTWGMRSIMQYACELLGLENDLEETELRDTLMKEYAAAPERTMLMMAYSLARQKSCITWKNNYRDNCFYAVKNDDLNKLYHFLRSLGYVMSDAETEFCNGCGLAEKISE